MWKKRKKKEQNIVTLREKRPNLPYCTYKGQTVTEMLPGPSYSKKEATSQNLYNCHYNYAEMTHVSTVEGLRSMCHFLNR